MVIAIEGAHLSVCVGHLGEGDVGANVSVQNWPPLLAAWCLKAGTSFLWGWEGH